MKTKYYIIDAARYPIILADDEKLPKDVIPLLWRTKHKASFAQGPYLLSEEAMQSVDQWFFTEDLYDMVCFECTNVEIGKFANWCRSMFEVKTDDGHEYFFRYYDSRVLRVMMPVFNTEQIVEFFAACNTITIYAEDYLSAVRYSEANGKVKEEKVEFKEGDKTSGLKQIKFPLPTLTQLKCLNKLKANQNEMGMKYGSKIERIEKLVASNGDLSVVHAEIERITNRNLTLDAAIEKNSKPLKGRASKARAKSFALISEKNKLRTKLEQPAKKIKAKVREKNPLRKAANLKNTKEQELRTKVNKAKLKAKNESGYMAARSKVNKSTSEMETLKHKGSKLDSMASNKAKSKIMNKTSELREVKDALSKPTGVNNAIVKVNKLQKIAARKAKKIKEKKAAKKEKESTSDKPKAKDDKPKFNLDF